MPKQPELHHYSDRASFERIMLLIATIANNPTIAPMEKILQEMRAAAERQGIEFENWSVHTLRADLRTLRQYEILKSGTAYHGGYAIGISTPPPKKIPKKPGTKKSKLTVEEMRVLHEEERLSYSQIAERAGVSRARVGQLLSPQAESAVD